MMTFNDIFKSNFLENVTSISVLDMILTVLLSFGIGLFIFYVYRKTYRGVMYSAGFGTTLIALTMITAVVILAVTSNVVLSLGMVGALSIVRFRNAVKNPMDLLYLFWSISAGIIVGVGLYLLSFVLCIVMTVLLLVLDLVPGAKAPDLLVLRALAVEINYEDLEKLLKGKCKYHKEKSRCIKNGEAELIIEIRTAKKEELLDALSRIKCLTQINCISHDGESRV